MADLVLLFVSIMWVVIAAGSCMGAYFVQQKRELRPIPPEAAVVIIPFRNVPPHLADLWKGICGQLYRPFRVVFVVESSADPVYSALLALPEGPPREVVVAGSASQRGQKVHNLLAALKKLQPSDAMIVFADSDILPSPDWLMRLLPAAKFWHTEVASGYRWMVPTDNRWSTAFICAIDSAVASTPRLTALNHAWGGSTALHRHTLELLDIESCWDRVVSDDLPLSQEVRAKGGSVRSPRDLLVLTPSSLGWRDGIAFARRQYLLARIHAPRLWLLSATITTIPILAGLIVLPRAFAGSKIAAGVLIVICAFGYVRGYLRERIPRILWNVKMPLRVRLFHQIGSPLYNALHALVIWSTAFGHTIRWAGRIYALDKRGHVRDIKLLPGQT